MGARYTVGGHVHLRMASTERHWPAWYKPWIPSIGSLQRVEDFPAFGDDFTAQGYGPSWLCTINVPRDHTSVAPWLYAENLNCGEAAGLCDVPLCRANVRI